VRLRGRPAHEILEAVDLLLACSLSDDRYEIVVRNQGEETLSGVALAIRYLDEGGRLLESLPVRLDKPLAPGEVRTLHRVPPKPRGGAEQPYALLDLERTEIVADSAHLSPPGAPERLLGSATKLYEGIAIAELEVTGDRSQPSFLFEVTNRTGKRLWDVVFAIVGADYNGNVMALVHAPLEPPSVLAPGETRQVVHEADTIFGMPQAVLTWSVIFGGVELEATARTPPDGGATKGTPSTPVQKD
jgi:hypothetical protein